MGSRRVWLVALGAMVFASRLPWIGVDYGSDPDCYRVLQTASTLLSNGRYVASRLPGYPAHELLMTLMLRISPAAPNVFSALSSAAACVLFALILQDLKIDDWLLGGVALAFVPEFYVSSTATIDYVPALACVSAAAYLVLRDRPILAGIALGSAIGFRITSGAMLLPLALWLWRSSESRRAWTLFVATSLAIGAAWFSPVFAVYGVGFWSFADNVPYPSWRELVSIGIVRLWGMVGTLSIGVAIVVAVARWRVPKRLDPATRAWLAGSGLVVALYVAAFLRLPHESGYLLPIVSPMLFGLGVLLPRAAFRGLAGALVLSPFLTVTSHGAHLAGPILLDHWFRQAEVARANGMIRAIRSTPANAAVSIGWMVPRVQVAIAAGSVPVSQNVVGALTSAECPTYTGRPLYVIGKFYAIGVR